MNKLNKDYLIKSQNIFIQQNKKINKNWNNKNKLKNNKIMLFKKIKNKLKIFKKVM